jgi:hypothetical protein
MPTSTGRAWLQRCPTALLHVLGASPILQSKHMQASNSERVLSASTDDTEGKTPTMAGMFLFVFGFDFHL